MFTRRKFPLHLGSYVLASGISDTIGRNSPHCLRILPHLSMFKHFLTNGTCGCHRFAVWCTRLHLRTSGCRTRADCRSSSCLPVPGRGRPDGEKRCWRRRRSSSSPSGPAVFAADSGCDSLPDACLRGNGNRGAYNTSCRTSCLCGSLDELHRKGSRCYPYLGKPLCPALPFREACRERGRHRALKKWTCSPPRIIFQNKKII